MKNNLIFWSGNFSKRITEWIRDKHPLFLQEWQHVIEQEKEYTIRSGHKPFNHGSLIDRAGKDYFTFHSKVCIDWVPFQEYPKTEFSDCMFETAQLIANKGKTIDFFWSGGLDSTAALLAFNELGLEKQLRVLMGGRMESPELFEKIVKGRIDYVWDETSTQSVVYGLAQPDAHVLCSLGECDPMFGCKSNFAGRGIEVTDQFDCWETKRRYYSSHNTWRYATNFGGDWVDPDNYMPFVMQPPIEKWLCNHVIAGDMVYYDLTHEGWGDWYATGEAHDAPSQKYYKKCKMMIRDFVYEITGDKKMSYDHPKVASGLRLDTKKPLRVLAITGDGQIVTHKNFDEFDWSTYIVDF